MFENVFRVVHYQWGYSKDEPELDGPERFGIRDRRPTKQYNCSPLGMVVYEVSVDVIASLTWKHRTYAPSGSLRKCPSIRHHVEQRSNGEHNREG